MHRETNPVMQRLQLSNGDSVQVQVVGNNPFDTLSEVLQETIDFKDVILRRLADIDPNDWRYQDNVGGEQLRSEVMLYERAMDRAIKLTTAISKLNIDERNSRLSQIQGQMMVALLMATLQELKLGHLEDQAKNIMLAHLERLGSSNKGKGLMRE